MKDSCRPDSCHKNANCTTVGPGRVESVTGFHSRTDLITDYWSLITDSPAPLSLRCACLQGYIGNGKVCYGNIMQRLNELNTEPRGEWTGQLSNAITLFSTTNCWFQEGSWTETESQTNKWSISVLLASLSWPLQNLGPFTIFVPINKGFKGVSVRINSQTLMDHFFSDDLCLTSSSLVVYCWSLGEMVWLYVPVCSPGEDSNSRRSQS